MNRNKRKHFMIRFVSAAVFIVSLGGFVGSVYGLVKMQDLHVNSMTPEALREHVFKETAQEQIKALIRTSSFDNASDKRFSAGLIDMEQSVVSPNHFFKIYNSDNALLYSKESPSKSGFITVYTLSDYQSVDERDSSGNYIKSQMIQKDYRVESQIVEGAPDVFWYLDLLITTLLEIGYRLYGILIVSAFLMLASMITYTKHAGIRQEDGNIEQNTFDRLPLEPFALLYLLVFGFSMSLLGESINVFYRDVPNAFLMGTSISLIGLGLSFVFYHSLIKRIKAKQLFVNSWVYRWGYLPIKRLYQASFSNRDLLLKVSMIVGASLLFDFITMISISNHNSGTMLFFWLIKTGVVVYFILKFALDGKAIREATQAMVSGNFDKSLDTSKLNGVLKDHAQDLNQLSDGMHRAVERQMKSERMKTDLITNVSHDIKTPLTSIINYIGLLEQKSFDDLEVQEYLNVLSRQSLRLKKLIEDLVEASKASSGTIPLNQEDTDLNVLLDQVIGEYRDRLNQNELELIVIQDEVHAHLDGNVLFRILDNLFGNICKYSLTKSRVYVTLNQIDHNAVIEIKNISDVSLNISSDELMERFVRGDASRNTEGSGLGLSIAKALTEVMGGAFKLEIDGDLFKVNLTFPLQ
ncbi:sensor histidine kinase [Erysipelothrix sp. strain 2 (EsS2-6-Brazil)]|uniref:sensor histidine kinase n=1 Tax=Erysipelothrix sp. strain 2 (EsS2-6-Brazil) TaxID=2500549 RepID=UPI001909D03C|nr:HAMP domain-containing sensor histidine kinase [Erysipelothrix sp. strain 2 (EsS2-6-Brazil)]MBK2402602.1 HAMP domain-containing histidine kinase [Erysipelothrix sp. strain 2 (EsS2-6-Brazil)]